MDGNRERRLHVTQGGSGGGVDETLAGFGEAMRGLTTEPHIEKRTEKLARSGHDEQHLFILADESALPFSVAYALMGLDIMPPGKPELPGTVTHLWVVVTFTPRLFLGTRGWERFDRNALSEEPNVGRHP